MAQNVHMSRLGSELAGFHPSFGEKKMKKFATAVAVMAACGGAQAATVSFQYGLPVIVSTTEINQTGSLGLFDSNLGTLTGASITINGEALFSFGGTNTAAQAQNANITSSTTLIWDSSIAALDAFIAETLGLSTSSGIQNYASGQTRNFGPTTQSGSQVDDLSTILASLQAPGGGTFDLNCQSLSGLTVLGGGGNISTTQATQAGCGASIEYTYTVNQAPEPASLALLAVGLLGAGVTTRRRKGHQR